MRAPSLLQIGRRLKHAYKDDSFTARLSSAAGAKQAALGRVRAIAQPGDPAFEERQRERQAIAAAREARQAERKAARAAEAERKAAERIAKEAEKLAAEQERVLALEAEKIQQKAARDARYAARKARQR